MSRKNFKIIAIIIILLVVGYIVYRGFFGQPKTTTTVTPSTANSASLVDPALAQTMPQTNTLGALPASPPVDFTRILPLGTKLDFTLVKKYNVDSKLFNYPKVDAAEVGPLLNAIIRPIQ